MLLLALVFELLVQFSTPMSNTEARCGADVSLPCSADFNNNKYFSVTWYKNNKEGIIKKVLENNSIREYTFPRAVSLNEQNSLLLTKATPDDSGRYECAVSANVGGQNLHLHVTLAVSECLPGTTTPSTTRAGARAETTEEHFRNETRSSHAPHLPLVWSLGGYGAVGLAKIILSVLINGIFHICSRRKRRS